MTPVGNAPKQTDQRSSNAASSSPQGSGKDSLSIQIPQISLPKGGGAIKGIDEKFAVNAANGTISFGVPLPVAGGRGFSPQLSLGYNSGGGNSPFGFGWNLSLPSISRKTDKNIPLYQDTVDSDTYVMSGAEDLVPALVWSGGNWIPKTAERTITNEGDYFVKFYRPRIEGSFARIELWRHKTSGNTYWRTIAPDNITTIYGKSASARIVDPTDPTRIYEWLIERSYDDKGHVIEFEYKPENAQRVPKNQAHTKNRIEGNTISYTNTYLKRVRYGNQDSFISKRGLQGGYTDTYFFETVFDYGEFDWVEPWRGEVQPWDYRLDAFSTYRPGFEVRTTRLCKRVLLFHHIPDIGVTKGYDGLVSSLELTYGTNASPAGDRSIWAEQEKNFDAKQRYIFTFLTSLNTVGYKKHDNGTYTKKNLPSASFQYQPHTWNLEVKNLDGESLVHLPAGADDFQYAMIDFYSEGIAGFLSEHAGGGLYYKENLGNAQFSEAKLVSPKPSFAGISTGALQIADLEGNGVKQIAAYGNGMNGFFELSPDEQWQPFQTFERVPNLDFTDPNLRMIDLDGDGKPDLLLTEHDAFIWYRSDGKKGYQPSQRVAAQYDEEKGPVLVFADHTLSIFLADMSGDGLTDLVRIRNGEICYWPNVGYGRFGAKVNMDNAPLFDRADQYDPSRLRLADIDGSGITDILYLAPGKCHCWFNLSGNGWSETPIDIPLPYIDDLTNITVADLMGNGTACVIWSSPLPGDAGRQMRYIDLMSGKKPHLLHHYENNMGKEVDFEFKSSTHFYLEDKKVGTPWVTKLPFPVHCLEKTIVRDQIRNTVFASSYSYHHGYFDYNEREFRGFGRVEQLDTEDFNLFQRRTGQNVVVEEHHQPPIRTVTWFHTGAFIEGKKMLDQNEQEYYKNAIIREYELPEPTPPGALHTDEYREALRAFKGMALRQEVYAQDGTAKQNEPYSTNRAAYQIRMVQPKGKNPYASFLVFGGETLSYGYDRNPADPRISHSIVLDSNEFGQPLISSSIVYPRVVRPVGANAVPDVVWIEQNKGHLLLSTAAYTNDIDDLALRPDDYRLRVAFESKSYELLGQTFHTGSFFNRQELLAQFENAVEIPFENDGDGSPQKRFSGHSRAYFSKNDLSGSLALGVMESLAIGFRSTQMAFTPGLVTKHYGEKVTDAMLAAAVYEHCEGDANWWTPSGTAIYPDDAPTQFFLPVGARDPLGMESLVEYDAFKLVVVRTIDAIGNTIWAENDYRTFGPILVTDPNGNRAAVETDELGMVVKSAVMGKAGTGEGDTLADPTARMEYDLFNWMRNRKPNFVHTFAREQHGAANPRWQESYTYSDGSGGVIMAKAQAGPGSALRWNEAIQALETVGDENTPRWIGNGRTVLNNKGNPIKHYEPYFSTTHEYEEEAALVEIGMSPVLFYDPIGRNYLTKFPNGTFAKAKFDPWQSKTYDTNDTVHDSAWYAERGSPDPAGTEPPDPEQRAAWLAAQHYNTPSTVHTDSLGRTIYAVTDYGGGKTAAVRSETDMLGRYSTVFDQKNRPVATGYINMAGAAMYGESAEKGKRWIFQDVIGRLVRIWDNSLREFYTTYDRLHRPVSAFVREAGTDILVNHTVYGDQLPDTLARLLNLKGIPFRVYDQAGVLEVKRLDFKGSPLEIERRLTRDFRNTIDWNALNGLTDVTAIAAAANPLLETEIFTAASTYDALGRPLQTTLPDGTVMRPTYNEGNGLDKLEAQLRGTGAWRTFLEKQDYDAKGQRQFVEYGNGLITRYFYDPKNFRLEGLLTDKKGSDPNPQTNTSALQNIRYHFDPVGNITHIRDRAQQSHFFRNAVVHAEQTFAYDAVYQLTMATGREHVGLNPQQPNHNDIPINTPIPHVNDGTAVRNYRQLYEYDDVGNLLKMSHIAPGGNWTRLYRYGFDDDSNDKTNRLRATNKPSDQLGGLPDDPYQYDLHGNMTRMPHLQTMTWNFLDQLQQVDLGGGGASFYVYAGGQRIRKVIRRNGGQLLERIYLGAVEIYRERRDDNNATPPSIERWTVHIADNSGRIAQVDTKTIDTGNSDPNNPLQAPLIRYQYANHLGSAVLETDEAGLVIAYEEYHPYGTTAYQVARSAAHKSLKRYRFSGKERDDETGLYYFGARYYAAWLGRWTSTDPAGFVDGLNLFRYCRNNPVMLKDFDGCQSCGRQFPIHGEEGEIGYRDNCGDHLYPTSPPSPPLAPDPPATPRAPQRARPRPQPAEPEAPEATAPALPAESAPAPTPPSTASSSSDNVGSAGSGGSTGRGAGTVTANPEGFTLEVPNNFDDGKIAAYRDRITSDRGVGNRSAVPGERRSPRGSDVTDAIRHENRGLQTQFESSLEGGKPTGYHTDHTVELQHITRGNGTGGADTVRAQDHRLQLGSVNTSQGSSARAVRSRSVASGAPEDVPAGGVARSSEMGRFYNSQRFRTAMRRGGYGLMVLGPILTLYAASQIDNDAIRNSARGVAVVEAGGAAYYMHGRFALGGANGFSAGTAAMTLGTRVMLGAGGAGAVLFNGYQAVQDFRNDDMGWAAVNAIGAIAGVFMLAAAVFVAPVVGAVAGGVVLAVGIAGLGRWLFS